ncbi:MAG: hypothetical protein U0223_12005 [Nitrospira sp.]|nr:hypothetical protein [Nitrospira sp.]
MAIANSLTDRTVALVSTLSAEAQQYCLEKALERLSGKAAYYETVFYLHEFNKRSDLEAYLDTKLSNASNCENSGICDKLKGILLEADDETQQRTICLSLIASIKDEEGWDTIAERVTKRQEW